MAGRTKGYGIVDGIDASVAQPFNVMYFEVRTVTIRQEEVRPALGILASSRCSAENDFANRG